MPDALRRHYMHLRKKVRQGWVRLLRSPGAPREIAGGMALGLFVSMIPALQMPVVLLLVAVLRKVAGLRLSTVAALTGVWLTNPLTGAALYGMAWFVGRQVLRPFVPVAAIPAGFDLSLTRLVELGPFALQVLLCLLVGGVLCGVPIAVAGYHLTLRAVRSYQRRVLVRRQALAVASGARSAAGAL